MGNYYIRFGSSSSQDIESVYHLTVLEERGLMDYGTIKNMVTEEYSDGAGCKVWTSSTPYYSPTDFEIDVLFEDGVNYSRYYYYKAFVNALTLNTPFMYKSNVRGYGSSQTSFVEARVKDDYIKGRFDKSALVATIKMKNLKGLPEQIAI